MANVKFAKGTITPSTSTAGFDDGCIYFNLSTCQILLNNGGSVFTFSGLNNQVYQSRTTSTSNFAVLLRGTAGLPEDSSVDKTDAAHFSSLLYMSPGNSALYLEKANLIIKRSDTDTNTIKGVGHLCVGKSNNITSTMGSCVALGTSNSLQNSKNIAIGDSNTIYDNEYSAGIGRQLIVGTSNISSLLTRVYVGQYNNYENQGQFCVGTGTSNSARYNGFRVDGNGATAKCYGLSSFSSSGAGVAETWEWEDGNVNREDRRGKFITLEGDKIRIASPSDKYILGVIDPAPFVVGGVYAEFWKNRFKRDVFGKILTEEVEVPAELDEQGNIIRPAGIIQKAIENPEFDPTLKYISRDERIEFAEITSKGIVVMIDDGTCKVDSYATVGEGGIATTSDTNYTVRVIERIDETHIRVYIDSVFINN